MASYDLNALLAREKALTYALRLEEIGFLAKEYYALYEKSRQIWSVNGIERIQMRMLKGAERYGITYEHLDQLQRIPLDRNVRERVDASDYRALVPRLWGIMTSPECPEASAAESMLERQLSAEDWPFEGRTYIHASMSQGHRKGMHDSGHIYLADGKAIRKDGKAAEIELGSKDKRGIVVRCMRAIYGERLRMRSDAHEELLDIYTEKAFYDMDTGEYSFEDIVMQGRHAPKWISNFVTQLSQAVRRLDPAMNQEGYLSPGELGSRLDTGNPAPAYAEIYERIKGTREFWFIWHSLFNPKE